MAELVYNGNHVDSYGSCTEAKIWKSKISQTRDIHVERNLNCDMSLDHLLYKHNILLKMMKFYLSYTSFQKLFFARGNKD